MNSDHPVLDKLYKRQASIDSLLCVGLDPDGQRLPASVNQDVFEFNRAIVDATAEYASCFKPQIAHHSALSAENDLIRSIEYIQSKDIPVILDAKRGDVGSTAEKYAQELFDRYGADAVTINPYMGYDAMAPFIERADKLVFILCRTSNPGGSDLQNLKLANDKMLFEQVAELAATRWNSLGNVGLVVGATRPEELARVRELTGEMPFLLPGIGAQGGDVVKSLHAGQGGGLVISSSRAILYASSGEDFAEAAADTARVTRDEINRARAGLNR